MRTAADELEAQLEEDAGAGMSMHPDADADADADGEPDPSFSLAQEEEERGEREKVPQASVVAAPRRSAHHQKTAAPPPPVPHQSKARPTPSKKSALATTAHSAKVHRVSAPTPTPGQSSSSKPRPRPIPPAAAPPTSTPPTLAASGKRAVVLENRDVDVEDFEIRGPIAPVTTPSARRSSTATTPAVAQGSSFSLALPTASAGPDPLAHQGLLPYNGGSGGGSGAAAESDDEWDEILAQPDRSQPHHQHQHGQRQQEELMITIDDEPDDGLDFLERELLGEDEPMGDGDGDEDEEEEMEEDVVGHPHSSRVATGPMSMNQFAGGEAAMEDDDDDYSSSDESDED